MATCKQTAQELIQDVFSPSVAVLTSSEAEEICKKNNLSFVELVQPFCRINTEMCIRDPSNIAYTIRNLRIVMKDMNFQPLSSALGKKMMSDAVSSHQSPAIDGILYNTLSVGNYVLKYYSAAPWFEAYREVFFQVTYPTEHDFTHHYLACIFVVSSSHSDPLSQIGELTHQQMLHQQQSSSHTARWFFPTVFRYYVLLHDVSAEDLGKAETIYQSMKSQYGASSCHLLQINSGSQANEDSTLEQGELNGSANMPDPWSQFLPKTVPNSETITGGKISEENISQTNCEGSQSHLDNDKMENDNGESSLPMHHPLLSSVDNSFSNSVMGMQVEDEQAKVANNTIGRWSKNNAHSNRHGLCLTSSDMDRIRVFVQDFCIQGLIPFVEKQIRILSDQVANRKGIHRSFLNVKKWFVTKPGVQGPSTSTTSVVYSQDAPELQVRKLGDLAFLFQLYDLAYQAYHNAKRDFTTDQAWLYFAGAMEMAALSIYMQGANTQRPYPPHYMDSAITTYLNTCKLPQFATRATLLSTECLKGKGMYTDAASQFIRMTSDADLPSALLLEQAAHCFINSKPALIRKYAFHIILAGHRFSKAGQRKHALRAYKQAEQVYKGRGWDLAEDHISFIVGRQSQNLKQLEGACAAFRSLLTHPSQQPPAEQATFLREYLFVLKHLLSQKSLAEKYDLPCLPLPIINSQDTKLLLGEPDPPPKGECLMISGRGFETDSSSHVWLKLQELVISASRGSAPIIHQPQIHCFSNDTDNSTRPLGIVGETITVELHLQNPLRVPLVLNNVFLLWIFTPAAEGTAKEMKPITNEVEPSKSVMPQAVIQTAVLSQLNLDALSVEKVHLSLKPKMMGDLHVTGIAFTLCTFPSSNQQASFNESSSESSTQKPVSLLSIHGKQLMDVRGPCLLQNKGDKSAKVYAPDFRLKPSIIHSMPKLQVKFSDFPTTLLCGEVRQVTVEFSNVGQCTLHRLLVASSTPDVFSFGSSDYDVDNNNSSWLVYKETSCSPAKQLYPIMAECDQIDRISEIFLPDGNPCHLEPGTSITVPLWIRGHDTPGNHTIDFLFYYETTQTVCRLRHRVLQYENTFTVLPSLSLQAEVFRSSSFEDGQNGIASGSKANSLILQMETENITEDVEINLIQVACVSQNWCLILGNEGKGTSMIRPRENLHLLLKAASFNSRSTVSSQKVMVFSHVPLGRVEVDSSSSPCSDFSLRSRLKLQPLISDHYSTLQSFPNREEPKNAIQEALEYSQNIDLTVTLLWKAKLQRNDKNIVVMGQHHVTVEKLNTSVCNSPLAKPIEEKPPIHIIPNADQRTGLVQHSVDLTLPNQALKCTMCHPFHVQHNFSKNRLVIVPVMFVAHNCCQIGLHITVNGVDELPGDSLSHHLTSQPFTQEDSQCLKSRGFTWVGPSQREVYINPNSTVHLPMQACFSSPGTYNLGNLIITVGLTKEVSHQETHVHHVITPCIIVISASSLGTQ